MAKDAENWIVICPQARGNPQAGYRVDYDWDGERFPSRDAAIKHGFEVRESDDFNVCSLRRNALTGFYWMRTSVNDPEAAAKICAQHEFTLRLTEAK
jgi:hypothetical protein